jgi:phosphate transport system substrate-binding protein
MRRLLVLRKLSTRALILVLALTSPLAMSGCGRSGSGASDQLTVSGSTTILPIAEISGEMFDKANPDVRVLVSGVGSSAGIESVVNGSCDIGTSSRDLGPTELHLGLVDTPIAYDAIAVIVNPGNPVSDLTMDQVRGIFTGRITNWNQVGGPDLSIGLVNRDEASGTREAFKKLVLGADGRFDPAAAVLPGTGQVRSVVGETRGAVGYISLGFVDKSVRAVSVGGVQPSEQSVRDRKYPIHRLLHFFTKGAPTGLAKRFTDFVLSHRVQDEVVADAGFIPLSRSGGVK